MAEDTVLRQGVTATKGVIRTVRPWQWYKQGVMFLGILFSKSLFDVDALVSVGLGAISFTFVAGSIYIFNDINDIEADRQHPRKRHRPIASGQLSVPLVGAVGFVLVGLGFALAGTLGVSFIAVLGLYVVQNLLYSLYLKRLLFVDIIMVAVGFVLRAVAGVVVIDVYLSPWLIVSTFLLALILILGKRRHELSLTSETGGSRETLESYSLPLLDKLLNIMTATLLVAYTLYTFSRADPEMMLTLPFAVFGIFRYHYLVEMDPVAGQPKHLLSDTQMMVNALVWVIVTGLILYDSVDILVRVVT